MSEQDENSTTIRIPMSEGTALFYKGVAAGSKVLEAWQPIFTEHQTSTADQERTYWFYVGLVAANQHDLTGESDVTTFVAGAATRAPSTRFQMLPDDWPDELDGEQEEALSTLVHDVASQQGSQVNNDGPESQVKFLLDHGVSLALIKATLRF